jgi:hypothetical protein
LIDEEGTICLITLGGIYRILRYYKINNRYQPLTVARTDPQLFLSLGFYNNSKSLTSFSLEYYKNTVYYYYSRVRESLYYVSMLLYGFNYVLRDYIPLSASCLALTAFSIYTIDSIRDNYYRRKLGIDLYRYTCSLL